MGDVDNPLESTIMEILVLQLGRLKISDGEPFRSFSDTKSLLWHMYHRFATTDLDDNTYLCEANKA